MKCKAGNTILFQKFKDWFYEKLKTEVYVDTDAFPKFGGKEEYIQNLFSAQVILPITQDDIHNQEILEAKREREKNAWAVKLDEQRKANETVAEKMAKAELRMKKLK